MASKYSRNLGQLRENETSRWDYPHLLKSSLQQSARGIVGTKYQGNRTRRREDFNAILSPRKTKNPPNSIIRRKTIFSKDL